MKNRDYQSKKRVVEVHDLSFLSDRNHRYGWLKRHYRHHRLRHSLRKARTIIADNSDIAKELTKYYFVAKDRITIR